MPNIKCKKCGDYIPEEMINDCPVCSNTFIPKQTKNKQKKGG